MCVQPGRLSEETSQKVDKENVKAAQFSRWKSGEGHIEKREGQGQLHET